MTTTPLPPHQRTVRLPLGYRATFAFSPEAGLGCEWHPGVPHVESPRAWRKFFAAYTAARDDFIAEAATSMNISVLVADLKGGRITGSTVIRPEGRHR